VQRAAWGADEFSGLERLVLEATAELLSAGSASESRWRQLVDALGTRAAMEVVVLVGEYAMHIAAFTTWGIEPAEGAPELP
jgi:4-carboxymuconolactone decarboxylase